MKAEDWERLGEHLKANAEYLEGLALADDTGLPAPNRMTNGISWLMSKGLIEEDSELLHLSGLLLDVGAQISIQGFERVAPDLKETLIAIEQLCEAYHDAKAVNSINEAERHLKRLIHTSRQVINHLRNEHSQTRAFIEGGYGFSPRLSDRLRDIKNAIGRLQRLHEKLGLFSHTGLLQLTRSDHALRRVLIDGLLAAVSKNRLALDEMIGRLDRLSLTVRKRNRMRQVAHAVDLFLQAGNEIDLEPLLDRPDAAAWVRAEPMKPIGNVFCDVSAGESLDDLELFIGSLPLPKVRVTPPEPVPRDSKVVPPSTEEPREMERPFAREHLEAMLRMLIVSGNSQSALEYWEMHGDPNISNSIWLYALDGYVQLQAALSKTRGKALHYRLRPTFEPFSRVSANRRVLDLTLERTGRLR
ncbi:TPA: hypothetical protein ACGPO2_001602 [Pseudomonas aeruginosa]